MVDYRDRISVSVWVVLLALTASLLVKVPSTTLVWMAFGTPLSVELSAGTLLGALLVVITASGTEAVVRAHPLARERPVGAPARGPPNLGSDTSLPSCGTICHASSE